MSKDKPLTETEAIKLLRILEARWPKSLWLFANGGGLSVMKNNGKGDRAFLPIRGGRSGGGVDPDYEIAKIRIPSDGGDW